MLVDLPPMLLSTLERVNALQMAFLQEDDAVKSKRLKDDHGRERSMLLILLNEAVASSEAAHTATTN